MAQVDGYTIPGAPLSMAVLAARLEALFAAAGSLNRGSSAPDNPFDGMVWVDTSVSNTETWKYYKAGWFALFSLNTSTGALTFFRNGSTSTVLASAFALSLMDDADADTALSTLGVSAFAKTLLDDANASTALSTLGVSAFIKTLLDDANASTALSTLGVSAFIKTLLDDADAATARDTLGISFAALITDGSIAGNHLVAVTDGTNMVYHNGTGTSYNPYVQTTPVKIWEYVVGRKGVFRLVYTFAEAQTRVRTFVDGTEYGDLRTSSNTYTETITVEPGNKIQIWAWSTAGIRQLSLSNVMLTCNDAMYLAPGGKLLVG